LLIAMLLPYRRCEADRALRAGYAKDEIQVRIGEAGTEVAVACARKDAFTVEATAAGRLRVAHRQVVEGFRRVFDVPPGADVARITVGFEEDDGLLVVILPKLPRPDPLDDDDDDGRGDDDARLDVESASCVGTDSDSGVDVDEELDLGDEACSLELEHEDWVDVESESEPEPPPRDVAVRLLCRSSRMWRWRLRCRSSRMWRWRLRCRSSQA
jgi:hypothetical protein